MATSKAKKREVLDEVVDALRVIEDATRFIDESLAEKDVLRGNDMYLVRERIKWTQEVRGMVKNQLRAVQRLIGELETGDRTSIFDRLLKAKCSG